MTLDQQLEGLLFYKAAAVKKTELAAQLEVDMAQIEEASSKLHDRLVESGVRLVRSETELELVTAPELDSLITSIRKDELSRDIGKAGAETLAIILYRGPIARAEIDRIRGVNSSFIIRNLLVRGLIERDNDGKGYRFTVTATLLSHLGVTEKTALPEYEAVLNQLETFEANLETD